MPVLSLQLGVRLPHYDAGTVLRGLAALLVAAVPGAILICILHCSIPSYAHQHAGHGPSPFLCNHSLKLAAEVPPPLSTSLVTGIVQGLAGPAAPAAPEAALLYLLVFLACSSPGGRPADAPPAPPPRPRVA